MCWATEGKGHIHFYERVSPIQHAPRHIPVPLRDLLKQLLDDLTNQDNMIATVQKLIPAASQEKWLLAYCLDFSWAILCEHYAFPAIEDVATRSHGANILGIGLLQRILAAR